ncbi:Acetyltransferase (GNAT) family protein [Poriferisphaera corsica]|uniref:Acetyltransferase (GNAT) family protein n=1 Tax=Poriferisphaera corsica TaxID=2528020 RepID=A0A517YTL6_9BACT|nr:N-acetyltransferase [Poriferisphaera corsica]QDU33583.1 Acetyltransferase (GNAT) family protein [Poriferisphaera corsica]
MLIREARESDFNDIWPIFEDIVGAGDTYAYERNTGEDEAFEIWMVKPRVTYVVEDNGVILGTYYIVTNQSGPGKHVCNCGYMVARSSRGQGLATKMCEHSQVMAKELGYCAMQFNFVAESNEGAVRLWERMGFEIVGRLPRAFNHPKKGLIDAFVMYKRLK